MFKITPISDPKLQALYAKKCGTTAREGLFAYSMIDVESGELMGISQFEIGKGIGIIYDLREADGLNDFEAMFILGRQTMNFIDLCGAHQCKALKDAGNERLLHAIGFREADNELICNMEGMFDGHCDGHAVKL